jgi:peptide chain release factor 1
MQDSRSQHQNKAWAWEILRSRLAEKQYQERVESKRAARQQELGTANRSDRIRSYSIGASRVTDHRIGYNSGRLQAIMDGQLEELVDALKEDFATRRIDSILAGRGDLER